MSKKLDKKPKQVNKKVKLKSNDKLVNYIKQLKTYGQYLKSAYSEITKQESPHISKKIQSKPVRYAPQVSQVPAYNPFSAFDNNSYYSCGVVKKCRKQPEQQQYNPYRYI